MNKKLKDSKQKVSRAFEFSTTTYSENEEDAWEDLSMEVGMTVEVAKRSFVLKEVTE